MLFAVQLFQGWAACADLRDPRRDASGQIPGTPSQRCSSYHSTSGFAGMAATDAALQKKHPTAIDHLPLLSSTHPPSRPVARLPASQPTHPRSYAVCCPRGWSRRWPAAPLPQHPARAPGRQAWQRCLRSSQLPPLCGRHASPPCKLPPARGMPGMLPGTAPSGFLGSKHSGSAAAPEEHCRPCIPVGR